MSVSLSLVTDTLSILLQYLRIKRAVQAAFNTESSYLSAKLAQMQKGGQAAREAVEGQQVVDPMAALDQATGVRGFVAASSGVVGGQQPAAAAAGEDGEGQPANADEIVMDDDDDDDDE